MAAPLPDPAPLFERLGPVEPISPLVCSVPHAGRFYPPDLLAAAAVPRRVLELLEDRFADLLVAGVLQAGATVIIARVARAWIDLNRSEDDLDDGLRQGAGGATLRARSGLGLLPRRVGNHDLWRRPASAADAAARVAAVHRPYHAAIHQALDAAHRRFGYAILIDCHSMPTLSGANPARVVIGDDHGRAARKGTSLALAQAARNAGFPVAINAPYVGAYSVTHHGCPVRNIHALQIELDRALYLDGARRPGAGLTRAQALVATLAETAATHVGTCFDLAAE